MWTARGRGVHNAHTGVGDGTSYGVERNVREALAAPEAPDVLLRDAPDVRERREDDGALRAVSPRPWPWNIVEGGAELDGGGEARVRGGLGQ